MLYKALSPPFLKLSLMSKLAGSTAAADTGDTGRDEGADFVLVLLLFPKRCETTGNGVKHISQTGREG